jgi:hypothetical protein
VSWAPKVHEIIDVYYAEPGSDVQYCLKSARVLFFDGRTLEVIEPARVDRYAYCEGFQWDQHDGVLRLWAAYNLDLEFLAVESWLNAVNESLYRFEARPPSKLDQLLA